MDIITLRKALESENYIFDEEFLVTVYVALKLEKPLLIEGAAGVGKTEVAKVLASVFKSELIRLQCYEGLDESKALYEWNYQKQLLSIQLNINNENNASNNSGKKEVEQLFSREFLLERPLIKAINSPEKCVLLIDEIDKTDEEFEAFLLEILSDFQVSIPELGTIKAKNKPIVILTSNNNRPLSDALKRRCAYLYIDYPDVEKEAAIINAKIPGVTAKLSKEAAAAVAFLRGNNKILKKPSIAETLDWVSALMALGKNCLDADGADKTLGFILKNSEDIFEFRKDGGFDGFFDEKHN
ncbi:AAA domain (dynein-related subfamily) [Oxobacter pfennigii]|uniref:AAA domain (Dynein-related subfamily) n=1 Tax=Oxobacter pfennigii TaxID=36849 RepID=A0A0P8W5B0_9CLOT|nr:MoxR family ATPase [Oxobacter pfennigii]KPU43805.1 AAA domain (dynein-related subfamily) [Oxobacter pfennigii]